MNSTLMVVSLRYQDWLRQSRTVLLVALVALLLLASTWLTPLVLVVTRPRRLLVVVMMATSDKVKSVVARGAVTIPPTMLPLVLPARRPSCVKHTAEGGAFVF